MDKIIKFVIYFRFVLKSCLFYYLNINCGFFSNWIKKNFFSLVECVCEVFGLFEKIGFILKISSQLKLEYFVTGLIKRFVFIFNFFFLNKNFYFFFATQTFFIFHVNWFYLVSTFITLIKLLLIMKWLSPCPVKNFVIKIFFLNLNEMASEELTEIKKLIFL